MASNADILGQLIGAVAQGGSLRGGGGSSSRGDSGRGLGDILGGLLGGGAAGRQGGSAGSGNLGDILGGLLGGGAAGQQGGSAGSGNLGDILGGLLGGAGPAGANVAPAGAGAAPGGLGDILGSILGGAAGPGGGAQGQAGAPGGGLGGIAVISLLAMQALKAWQAQKPAGAPAAPAGAATAAGFDPQSAPGGADALSGLLVKAMVASMQADGVIDEDEQRKLAGRLDQLGVPADARDATVRRLTTPIDPSEVVDAVESPEMALQVYAASVLAISVDTPQERAYLDRLAKALGIDPGLKAQMEGTLGRA